MMDIDKALIAAETTSTRRNYRRYLVTFAEWLGEREIAYASVMEYRAKLQDDGWQAQNVNQALSAIRFYTAQAVAQEWVAPDVLVAVRQVPNLKIKGRKLGHWLSKEEAARLLNAPSALTVSGIRDRAILAVLLGAGLRRSELCALEVKSFEQRDAGEGRKRWVIVDVKGKHGRTRSIPVADWVKGAVDAWLDRAHIRGGAIFRAVRNEPLVIGQDALSTAAIFNLVSEHGGKIGRPSLAPHDLRRTFARLAYEGKAPLKEIQASLGHGSVAVTERYVNAEQDIHLAPGDMLGIYEEST